MILRRALGAGLAAVLAACPALALPTPAAAATKPGYVAVVISGHGAHCVKWKSGITGDTVLNDAATVAYRNDGLIVQIDRSPSSGTADASHFWSYWHDTSGTTWSYSNVGASGYHPAAGSVEGWSYDNGKSSPPAPSQSPSGLYAKTCGAKDTKRSGGTVVAPTTSSVPHPRRTQSTSRAHDQPSTRHRAQRSAPPSSTPSSTPSTPSTPSASGTPSTSAPRPASSSASHPVASSAAPPASGGSATGHAAPSTIDSSPTASSSSSGSPVGLLVVLGVIVVLAGGAGALALRRRNT